MRKGSGLKLMSLGLAAALMLPVGTQAFAIDRDEAIAVMQEGCAVTSIVSGQLNIHDAKGKTHYYSGRIEANEACYVPGLKSGQQYKVIVEADEGSTYFGLLDVISQGGQLMGELQLDEIGSIAMGRSLFSTIEFEVENNNSIKKANALKGNTIYGRIEKKLLIADEDYFKITIPSDGDYAFVLDNIPSGKDYDLALYNSKSKQIATSATTADTEIIKISDAKANEVYYAMVEGYKKASDNNNNYRLQYAPVLSVSDDHGNKQSLATEIELTNVETFIGGNIDYPKDVDFFTFSAMTDGIYSIYTTGNLDTVGSLYDSKGALLMENDNGLNWNFSMEVNLTAGERYFVAVKHTGVGTGAYTLHVVQPEVQGPQEPNAGDSFDNATPIDVGDEKSGWHTSATDARYFVFTPSESGSYGFYTSGNAVNTYGELIAADQLTIITENDNSGDDQHFSMAKTLLAGNVYYIKVSANAYNADANQFTLSVQKYSNPNDSEFGNQYYLLNTKSADDINALPALSITQGQGIKVAVADTGIDAYHDDLYESLNMTLSYNFTHDMPDIFPKAEPAVNNYAAAMGHGTHIAGLIGAEFNNGIGMSGVAPGAELVGYKVFGVPIPNNNEYNNSFVAFEKAIVRAQESGVNIINASFGSTAAMKTESDAIEAASDILFVVAAGNSGLNLEKTPIYPACYGFNNILVVAWADQNGELNPSSNYGGPTAVAAPGSQTLSTAPYGKYEYRSGSSFATPIVSAIGALVWSTEPSLSASQVRSIITTPTNTTKIPSLSGKVRSGGMVDAYKAVMNDQPNRTPHSIQMDVGETRNPFAYVPDVKAVIEEIMDSASDSEKTGNLFVKFLPHVDRETVMSNVRMQTGITFDSEESGLENIVTINTSSVQNADALVEAFNQFNEIEYAEPIYMRELF